MRDAAPGPGLVRLRPSVLIAYGLPAFCGALLGLPLLLYLPGFYANDVGLGFAAVGSVLLAARLWDIASDLLAGWVSDRWTLPGGRRRGWVMAALPGSAVAVWLLFRPADGVSTEYLAAAVFATYLGWTLLTVPHLAWGAELSSDYGERTRIMAARQAAVLGGLLLTTALPTLLADPTDAQPASEAAQIVGSVAMIVAVLMPCAAVLLFVAVPEPPPAPRATSAGWRAAARRVTHNAPFRRLLASCFVNGIANGVPAALILLYITHVLARPDSLGLFLLTYFASGMAGMPVWLKYARRHGKHRAWCLALLFACIGFAALPLLGPGDVPAFVAVCMVTGVAFGADLALPAAMQADVVDVDTQSGGGGRAGLYFALWSMAGKISLALSIALAFPLLEAIGFGASGARDPEMALYGLTALCAVVPVAGKLVAVGLMWRYPLDEAAQRAVRQRIESSSPLHNL